MQLFLQLKEKAVVVFRLNNTLIGSYLHEYTMKGSIVIGMYSKEWLIKGDQVNPAITYYKYGNVVSLVVR